MTTKQKLAIIKECNRLARGGKPKDPSCGLCHQLRLATSWTLGYQGFAPFFLGWKHHTGNQHYPVPGAYWSFDAEHWSGQQGKYRRSLARYAAKKLKETL